RQRLLNAKVRKKSCAAAKGFWLKDRESATPEAGAGRFPTERSHGPKSIFGSLGSILRRPSHRSSYSWKRFIRTIDHLLSEVSMKQLRRKGDSTSNFESRLRMDLLSMSKGWAEPSLGSLGMSMVMLARPWTSPAASEERRCSPVKSVFSR